MTLPLLPGPETAEAELISDKRNKLMYYNLLIIIDKNQTYWESHTDHELETDRFFQYTDPTVKKKFESNLQKLKNLV